MFIGYQNNIATFIANSKSELENKPCVSFDRIEEVEFAEMFNGVIYTSEEDLKQAKSDEVRAVRNNYLEKYVDPVVCNPLRWAELTPEEQQQYTDYRRYLLDITEDESFPNLIVLTFDEWKVSVEVITPNDSENNELEEENAAEVITPSDESDQASEQVSD